MDGTSGWYEIRLQGRLDDRWASWFDGLSLDSVDGVTTLRGPVADQAALHGILARLRDLGLPLIAVAPVAGPAADELSDGEF